jgi:hypothetical protein
MDWLDCYDGVRRLEPSRQVMSSHVKDSLNAAQKERDRQPIKFDTFQYYNLELYPTLEDGGSIKGKCQQIQYRHPSRNTLISKPMAITFSDLS